MRRNLVLILILCLGSCSSSSRQAVVLQRQSYETPLERTQYSTINMQGWTVLVAPGYTDVPLIFFHVLALLDDHLYRINRVIPSPALEQLKAVEIWLEVDMHKNAAMGYHPSEDWLSANGYNPDKAGAVEVSNAQAFLDWSHGQPWMILHELAHAYHDQVLGWNNCRVNAAFRSKVEDGDYVEVLDIFGKLRPHYALTNVHEYFAETTEAYFGTNDIYPFVRSELEQVDPAGFELMKQVWYPPATD
jgi:hypothetical protein